jgi:hypothetical protein
MSLLLLFDSGRTPHALAGMALGRGTATAGMARVRSLAGNTTGLAGASGTLRAARALRGVAVASGTLTARLAVLRSLRGAAAGLALVRAQLARVGPLAGTASGAATILGRASCARTLAGVSVGWSRAILAVLSSTGTPASRMAPVGPEARTYRAAFDDRRFIVRREARVITPAAEDRAVHTQPETRSIDA